MFRKIDTDMYRYWEGKKKLKRYWIMLRLCFFKHGLEAAKYLKRKKIFAEFGDGCAWHSKKIPSEPELISIGNNVHVSADVRFITHDIMCDMFNRHPQYSKYAPWPFYKGRIQIKDNCMIGAGSTIMYDTEIGPNSIIAAGAVVTSDVPSGEIGGGVPARKIGYVDALAEKRRGIIDG